MYQLRIVRVAMPGFGNQPGRGPLRDQRRRVYLLRRLRGTMPGQRDFGEVTFSKRKKESLLFLQRAFFFCARIFDG